MSVFHTLRRRNVLNNPHGPTVEKIFVLVLLSAFSIKTWTLWGEGRSPLCTFDSFMLNKSVVLRRDCMSKKAIESFTAPFLSNRKLHFAKSKQMWTGKVCLVSNADFRTWEWSQCLAKMWDLSGPKCSLLRTWPLRSGKHPPLTSPQKFTAKVPQQLCLLIRNIQKLMATWKQTFNGT